LLACMTKHWLYACNETHPLHENTSVGCRIQLTGTNLLAWPSTGSTRIKERAALARPYLSPEPTCWHGQALALRVCWNPPAVCDQRGLYITINRNQLAGMAEHWLYVYSINRNQLAGMAEHWLYAWLSPEPTCKTMALRVFGNPPGASEHRGLNLTSGTNLYWHA
jgi:hypothetical protein